MTAPTRGAGTVADLTAQLDALREVLRAISVSPFDLEGVLGIVVERMSKLCHADIGMIYLPAGEGFFRAVASYASNPEHNEYERSHPTPVTPGTVVGRAVLSGQTGRSRTPRLTRATPGRRASSSAGSGR